MTVSEEPPGRAKPERLGLNPNKGAKLWLERLDFLDAFVASRIKIRQPKPQELRPGQGSAADGDFAREDLSFAGEKE